MKNRQEKKLADLTRQNVSLSSEVRSQSMKLSALQDENLRLLNLAGNVHYVEVSSENDSSDQLVQLKKEKEELSLFLDHVLQDLEDKTPILAAKQRAFDALQEDYHDLLARWNAHITSLQSSGEHCGEHERVSTDQPSTAHDSDALLDAMYAEVSRLTAENQRAQERVAAAEQQRDFYRRLLVDRKGSDQIKSLLEQTEEEHHKSRQAMEKTIDELREREKLLLWEIEQNRGIVETREREKQWIEEERERFRDLSEKYQKRISSLSAQLAEISRKYDLEKFERISVTAKVVPISGIDDR